jgi:hypothetical protein
MHLNKRNIPIIIGVSIIMLSACVAKDVSYNEQQKRMQRCEQYIDRERERCFQGDYVTIEDYKEDYRAYERSKQKEAEKDKQKVIIIPESTVIPAVKPEDKS